MSLRPLPDPVVGAVYRHRLALLALQKTIAHRLQAASEVLEQEAPAGTIANSLRLAILSGARHKKELEDTLSDVAWSTEDLIGRVERVTAGERGTVTITTWADGDPDAPTTHVGVVPPHTPPARTVTTLPPEAEADVRAMMEREPTDEMPIREPADDEMENPPSRPDVEPGLPGEDDEGGNPSDLDPANDAGPYAEPELEPGACPIKGAGDKACLFAAGGACQISASGQPLSAFPQRMLDRCLLRRDAEPDPFLANLGKSNRVPVEEQSVACNGIGTCSYPKCIDTIAGRRVCLGER